MNNKIIIILPAKEFFDKKNSGAASIFVKESLENENLDNYLIYGSSINKIEKKYSKIFYKSNEVNKFFSNYKYIKNFVDKFKNSNFNFFEIHNRPEYALQLKKVFVDSKILIYFHNDPNKLRGCDTIQKKIFLYNNFRLVFLSKWIEKQFYKNTNLKRKLNSVIYPGAKKKLKKKEKIIFFCGKLNTAKGYDLFVEATRLLKKNRRFSEWKVISAGSESRRTIKKEKHIKELGQISNEEVSEIYEKASISVAPSKWNEPLGRLPIESSSKGCVPITSNMGGLPETNLNGVILKKNTISELSKVLVSFCYNPSFLKKVSDSVYRNFSFTNVNFKKEINILRRNFFFKKIKIKKILYVSNFNIDSKKRLFYSYANKFKSGLLLNKYKLDCISDREYMRSKRNLLDIRGQKKLNKQILQKVVKNKYDLILLGHTNNIDISTFKFIKSNFPDIKIIKLFIDSLSKEFFNFKKVFYDINFLDHVFVSSNPKIIPKEYRYKFHFLPYPVDKNIDYLKSYSKKDKKIDVFFALSHGQNRGTLKKGRIDEREGFIKKLSKILNKKNIKYFFPGTENIQPKWGNAFYDCLKNSKITLNISRGAYKDLYSSDRISTLIGNGCFIINEKRNNYNKIINKNYLINFENLQDLSKKIDFFLKREKIRNNLAKKLYQYYFKYFNSKKITKFVIDTAEGKKNNKQIWSNAI